MWFERGGPLSIPSAVLRGATCRSATTSTTRFVSGWAAENRRRDADGRAASRSLDPQEQIPRHLARQGYLDLADLVRLVRCVEDSQRSPCSPRVRQISRGVN